MRRAERVFAVAVTFHPDPKALTTLLDALSGQVECVAVVDNGSGSAASALLEGRNKAHEHCIPLDGNYGIAAAQNRGIDWCRQCGADYILLLDQDSEPAADMVERLLAAIREKAAKGIKVAAVGPRYLDPRQGNPPPFIQVKGLKVERQPCLCLDSVVEVDYLIASGCLIPMEALDAVGGMQEELFIDYVDIEWGLRARHHGFQSFGVCAAAMFHDLGEAPIEFFGRKIPLHSPLRHYYHFRNAVWMYRQDWLPVHWKFADGWRLLLKYGFYTLFAKPRYRHWWMMTKGIWHGLTGCMGQCR